MVSVMLSCSIKAILFLLLLCWSVAETGGETVVDDCGAVHGRENRIGSVIVSSENLIVDTESAENHDGDQGRFKRDNIAPGFLSYVSELGFEGIEIDGYVFGLLERGSWSLNVTVGDVASSEMDESILLLRRSNLGEYRVEGGAQDWRKFNVELRMRRRCPSRITLVLDGPATNNEYPGWGLQLSRVQLVQSWFANCTAACRFNRSECPASPPRQMVDEADSFRDVYFATSNIDIDSSNANQFFDGDNSRFTRSDNRDGEIVYATTEGIRMLDIEIYQYQPYDTRITVVPYNSEDCHPMELQPAYTPISQSDTNGWIHRIARFDLHSLPMCPRRVAVRMSGGENGWELEISRLMLNVLGGLEVNPAVNLRTNSGSSDDGDGSGIEWWMWLCGLIGVIVVCLIAAMIVQRAPFCCGREERGADGFPHFRMLMRRRRSSSDEEPNTQPSAPPLNATEPSFTFATVRIPSS